jgi:Cof subfamily protein (haloacid dehalogenase superfamily)
MIKAIFFDVDGTLLWNEKNIVPESARRSLRRLQEKGIQCVVATGRHKQILKMLPVGDIDFDGYILLTGQLCFDKEGNVLGGNPLKGKAKDLVVQMFREKTIPLMLLEQDRWYINFVNDAVRSAHKAVVTPVPNVGEYDGGEIYQAIAYVSTKDALVGLEEDCKLTRWNGQAVDIISKEGGKVSGIQTYLKSTGIRLEETMAFGDGENDVDMLEFAGLSVCMGNGAPEAKAVADYVTDSVGEDGIEKALIHFGLLD